MSDPADLTHRSWRFPEYIAATGKLYTPEHALDYFSHSLFWDKQSTNQVLKMQTMHTNMNGEGGIDHFDEAQELRRFTGVEFAVVHSRPPGLWIIHKRERLSPDEVRPIASYFILNDTIYQSPNLYTVLSTSLVTTLHSLRSSLDTIRQAKPTYTARTGYSWPIAPPKEPTNPDSNMPTDVPSQATSKQNKAESDLMPLLNAFQTTMTHITAATSLPVRDFQDEDDMDAENGDIVGGGRDRAMTRDSATPAPTGGKAKGGKAKRRRKSRAASMAEGA